MQRDTIISIIIVIVIILIVICILLNIKMCPRITQPTVPFDKIRNRLKTGDVIAFHGCSLLKATLMRWYLGCASTHVGMVIRKPHRFAGLPDSIFLFDLGPYTNLNPWRKSDVKMRSLESVLTESPSRTFALIPAERAIEMSDEDIEIYSSYKFNYFIPTMFSPYKRYKVCSSFVAKIHEDKGIGQKHSYTMSPCDFYNSDDTIFFTKD